MPSCAVPDCLNRDGGKSKAKLYMLPTKKIDQQRKQQWIANICRENLPPQDSRFRVCEAHFTEDQFEFDLQVRL